MTHEKHTSNKINKLSIKHSNKVKNFLHHASKYIVKLAQKDNINTIVIGNNKGWKNGINLSKKNNQSFVSMPYSKLIEMVKYKSRLVGLNVIVSEESYTSKCSLLDFEAIKKHKTYLGRRCKRGLFVTSKGLLINADAQAAGNIIRKVFGNTVFSQFDMRCVVQPKKVVSITEQQNKTLQTNKINAHHDTF